MPTTTPAQLFPVMTTGDDPDIPADVLALALAIEKRVVGVYTNASDRNAKTTAAGVQEGMIAYLQDTNTLTYYTGSAWADVIPDLPAFSHGSVVPSNASGSDGDVFFKV